MWLMVLESMFGFLFVLAVVTQIIWPLWTDAPLLPLFKKKHMRSRHGLDRMKALETGKTIEGEMVHHKSNRG